MLLVPLTVLLYVLSFVYFLGENANECSENLVILIFSLVFFIATALLRYRRGGNTFPGTLVNFWLALLVFSALYSKPDDVCNKLGNSKGGNAIQTIGHFFMTLGVLYGLATDVEEVEPSEDKATYE